jgi:hypothetical protein
MCGEEEMVTVHFSVQIIMYFERLGDFEESECE